MLTKLRFILRRLFSKRTVKMLCIGMEESKYAGSCPGTGIGATKFFNKVKPRCNYAKLLLSSQATMFAVRNELQNVCESNLAIIFYSGHGGQKKGSQNETDGKDEFLGLYDGPIMDNEIWNIVSQAKGRVFMIFDCCHSETMFRGIPDLLPRRNEPLDLLCWASCGEGEVGYSIPTRGGLFTTAILKNIKAGNTYDQAWKQIIKNKMLAKYETSRAIILKAHSDFDDTKIFS